MSYSFYAASGPQPEQLADEILQRIRFSGTGVAGIDEFTLHRYESKLRNVQERRLLDDKEYSALASVLFGLQRTDEAIQLTEEGLRHHPSSLNLLGTRAIAKIHVSQQGVADFDPEADWFDHPTNPDQVPLQMLWGVSSFGFDSVQVDFENEIQGVARIKRDEASPIEFGPFELEFDLEDFVEKRFDIASLVVPVILEQYFLGRLSSDEHEYLEERLGDRGLKGLRNLWKTSQVTGRSGNTYDVELISIPPGEFIALIRDVNLFGSGYSQEEALNRLLESIRDLGAEKPEEEDPSKVVDQNRAASDLMESNF